VDRIFSHPRYNDFSAENDIAVVRLSAPVSFSRALQPITLPTVLAAAETSALISGWGSTRSQDNSFSNPTYFPARLQGATVLVKSDADCRSDVGSGFRKASMICATTTNWMQDTCQGDSGGPLATLMDESWVITGITSWGYGCADTSAGVYTRVLAYVPWINARVPLGVG
jgi:secreted trypsin-like serine protease